MGIEQLAQRRKQLDLTQVEAARLAGVSLATWRRFETSTDSGISEESLRPIARVLRIAPAVLERIRSDPDLSLEDVHMTEYKIPPPEWAEKFNEHFQSSPLTPLQAAALFLGARFLGDSEGVMWEELVTGRIKVNEAEPFARLHPQVLFCVNQAWLAEFLGTFLSIADELDRGRVPYPACIAEEVALWLSLGVAEDFADVGDVEHGPFSALNDGGEDGDWAMLESALFQEDHHFEWLLRDQGFPTALVEELVRADSEFHPHRWWVPFESDHHVGEG